ncbi:MAG TPA: hypothetical protein VGU72_08690 [Beijerinckiaceae bacterium]|jgi:hypothetical protein|nr:hypothetical protein [Beijerinckiaceae bacterium]
MNVSHEQAIEIYAKMLNYRWGETAPAIAREQAERFLRLGDQGGHDVWMQVAARSTTLPVTKQDDKD